MFIEQHKVKVHKFNSNLYLSLAKAKESELLESPDDRYHKVISNDVLEGYKKSNIKGQSAAKLV